MDKEKSKKEVEGQPISEMEATHSIKRRRLEPIQKLEDHPMKKLEIQLQQMVEMNAGLQETFLKWTQTTFSMEPKEPEDNHTTTLEMQLLRMREMNAAIQDSLVTLEQSIKDRSLGPCQAIEEAAEAVKTAEAKMEKLKKQNELHKRKLAELHGLIDAQYLRLKREIQSDQLKRQFERMSERNAVIEKKLATLDQSIILRGLEPIQTLEESAKNDPMDSQAEQMRASEMDLQEEFKTLEESTRRNLIKRIQEFEERGQDDPKEKEFLNVVRYVAALQKQLCRLGATKESSADIRNKMSSVKLDGTEDEMNCTETVATEIEMKLDHMEKELTDVLECLRSLKRPVIIHADNFENCKKTIHDAYELHGNLMEFYRRTE